MSENKKKTTAVKKTAVKKTPKKGLLLRIVIILVVVGVIGYFGAQYFPQTQLDQVKVEEVKIEIKNLIPESATGNISLPEMLVGYDDVVISWESSNESVVSKLGVVNSPSYEQEDKIVNLTATISINSSDAMAKLFNDFFKVNNQKIVFTITIKHREASSEEKIRLVKVGLFVPLTTATDIGLLTQDHLFNSVNINWQTSNASIMTAAGKKVAAGAVNLTATLTCEDKTETIIFNTLVTDKPSIVTALDTNFDNLKTGTYSSVWENGGWSYERAILATDLTQTPDPDAISEQSYQKGRFKAENGKNASMTLMTFVDKPNRLTFDYEIFATDKKTTYTKDTFLNVYYSENNVWVLLSKSAPLGSDKYTFDYDLSTLNLPVRFKIEIETAYASMRVDIDNVLITRYIASADVSRWIEGNIPASLSKSMFLPLTTVYGGIIEWTSSHLALSKEGLVTKQAAATKVVLTALVKGFGANINLSVNVTVSGLNTVTPVEIYFIDIGKYGQSDCGESIYIKYDNIDILVDAGDNIKASNQAIREVIDLYSEDKVIEYLIATHPDADHIGGLPFIFELYEVLNLIQFNGDHTTNLYQKYKTAYLAEECSTCTVLDAYNNVGSCMREITLGPDVFIEFLNTKNYEAKEPNTRSIVFILEAYGIRTLLTGDADNGSNSHLERDYMNTVGNIDILKAVHHGTKAGTTTEFLQAVDPEVVIITNGNYFGNKHGHPTYDAINRIYQYDNKITVYAVVGGDSEVCSLSASNSYKCELIDPMADRNGTIKITIDSNGYNIYSEHYQEKPLELSSTNFWITNPMNNFQYAK